MSEQPPDDLTLLRQYEPVLRHTNGEHFFPMRVDRYVERCALWFRPADGPAVELIPSAA